MSDATEVDKRVAVIFTALPVEYNEVRRHLKSPKEKVHPKGTIYEQGVFSSNGKSWNVGIAEIGEGNEQAALEVERAIQYFKPRIILFVGVAGGVKDVKLGDVVVATKVYGYESGKAGETFRPRPEVGSPNYKLISRAKAEARKDDWLQRLGEVTFPHPNVFVKPIAAGSKVINSTRSAVYEFIKSYYEDTLAVEMEGYGFLKAAYANPDVYALVIRGISDLIDGKEVADKAGSQKLASHHASAFAFEVLAKSYIESIDLVQYKHQVESSSEKTAVSDKNGQHHQEQILDILTDEGCIKYPFLEDSEPRTYICACCGEDMIDGSGCIPSVFIDRDGKRIPALKYGEEEGMGGVTTPCHDCGCEPGQYHHFGCDMELCPVCGGQALLRTCGHIREYYKREMTWE